MMVNKNTVSNKNSQTRNAAIYGSVTHVKYDFLVKLRGGHVVDFELISTLQISLR